MTRVLALIRALVLNPVCSPNLKIVGPLTPVIQGLISLKRNLIRPHSPPTSTFTTASPLSTHVLILSPESFRIPLEEKLKDYLYVLDASAKHNLDIHLLTDPGDLLPRLQTLHGGVDNQADFSSLVLRFNNQAYALVSIDYRDFRKDTYPIMQVPSSALAWT